MYNVVSERKFPEEMDFGNFSFRIRELLKNDGKKKILYTLNEFNNSTFRYRYFNFRETLRNSSEYSVVCFESAELPSVSPYISTVTAVVFQRALLDNCTNNFLHLCKNFEIPTVYDIDDLIYNEDCILDYVTNIGLDPNHQNISYLLGTAAGHTCIAKHCDSFITTTTYLKEHLVRDFGKPTYVIPNYYNMEQENCSADAVKNRVQDKSKYYIGYFSGSNSHQNDFGVCREAIIDLMKKYSNIYLKIVGFMTLENELAVFHDEGRVIFKPICSYEELQYEIAEVDLNVAPLVNYYFNDCKSELKFFESAIVKVPSVMSAVGVYNDIIKNGENGFICKENEWFDTLEKMYLDRELSEKIAENAYNYARENYHYDNFEPLIKKTLDAVSKKD